MKVTAFLFNPPGRGEFLTRSFDMPDSAMPSTPADFALRSVRAIKFFWPQAVTGKALELAYCNQHNVVEGAHWRVEWSNYIYIKEISAFVEKRINNVATLGELLTVAASIQPERRVTL